MPIDHDIGARLRDAWARLPAEVKAQVAPRLEAAYQRALGHHDAPFGAAVTLPLALARGLLEGGREVLLGQLGKGGAGHVDASGAIWGSGRYQQLDPRWLESVVVWLEHYHDKAPFNTATPELIAMPDRVAIAVAGDFGTGDWGTAARPAPSTKVRRAMARLQPDLTVHLGDVYYSGGRDETQTHLVEVWPRGALGSLSLNSNHDMLSGGRHYFDETLGSGVFSLQQRRSYFALESRRWIVVGLDTAYFADPRDMYEVGVLDAAHQLPFLAAMARRGKPILLFTHHNGLELDGAPTPLWSQVMSAFPGGAGPVSWYWGHVHAGVAYQERDGVLGRCAGHADVEHARDECCAGHAAIPWARASRLAQDPADPDMPNPSVAWYEDRLAGGPGDGVRLLNGFVLLQLEGAGLTETFYDEDGAVAWSSSVLRP